MKLGKGDMKIILQDCQQQMHGIRRHLRNRHMEHCYGGVKIPVSYTHLDVYKRQGLGS